MNTKLTLSILDIGPIRSNQSAAECFNSMLEVARLGDRLGYHRYWLAEHHNVAAVAASHTSVFAPVIGANTNYIRIGGCVLLAHYPPFLVAEQMGIVEACFPGRVDLGIGRSSGADWATSSLLRGGRETTSEEGYVNDLTNLLALTRREGVSVEQNGLSYHFNAVPNADSAPSPWILGTSMYSAQLAAELGLPYAFGYHIRAEGAKEAIALYKARFKPSSFLTEPKVLVSAIVVVGETDEEAQRLSLPQLHFMCAFRSGEPVQSQMLVEEADDVDFPSRYDGLVAMFRKSWIIGSPDRAAEGVATLAAELGVSEIMINTVTAAYRSQPADRSPNREFTLEALAARFPQ
ncbi:MsnO8 family LLM class oxidoreductase [Aliirhizobium cellulosilyticum]|uniref:Luciferase family oxidoreductase group 1 n=1 Tax=Aliirhizobium cellulosilyticum TaxID=393664 RepID=A0A7W6Y4C7_9HYPH|nr:MsnO8 family LLM class oxidoreductase [Rhizobium cellulosilyticum]MBB4349360.1 luciferase family oxidoreductase group 1 [Rhizobium cellulosilyticum]MBB4412418.1 luciferase family oxidoreductase group 1 [Rhizobium cellulosilyticum]MBB4447050.1 luciferase family oxidoreductase group 1 [Rhizobium cellulosilyticum]